MTRFQPPVPLLPSSLRTPAAPVPAPAPAAPWHFCLPAAPTPADAPGADDLAWRDWLLAGSD